MAEAHNLLAHLSWRFHPRMEELAVAALTYILNRHPESRGGMEEVLKAAVPDASLSDQPFETEASDLDGTRPDMLQKGDDGSERLFIEAKFYASLTPNQPVPYLKRLPDDGVSALMFLAPSGRVQELWPKLLSRLDANDMTYSEGESFSATIHGTGKHLLIVDWTTLLDRMKEPLQEHEAGLAEIRQFGGLVQFAKDGNGGCVLPGEKLVRRVTDIGKAAGWLNTRGLNVTRQWHGFGRYAYLGRRYRLEVWLGDHSGLSKESGFRHLWVRCGQNQRVASALKDRMNPHHIRQEGKVTWVAVVPEGDQGACGYAAALERTAGILDGLTEPWGSRADVLAEIGQRYAEPVMGTVHRGEYVEALVALALKGSDWNRKAPWEAWHFENDAGVGLKLKHSARSSPRSGNAPEKVFWRDNHEPRPEADGHLTHIYVFAWHGGAGESADQRDPNSWQFYVVLARDLPERKTISLKALGDLTTPCRIKGLADEIVAVSETP